MKLKTKRLILRQPKMSDWKDLVEGLNDFEVAKRMSRIVYPYNKKEAEIFIKKTAQRWKEKVPENIQFSIELKSEKKIIGGIGISNINNFNGTANTGSWINKKYWRQGYITEAKIVANDFIFNKLKLRRLNSYVYYDNKASNATQKKMGYKLEGTMRKYMKNKATGKIHDMNVYGLLKEDWEKTRRKLVK